jgi:hypothetical protein
VCIPEWLDILFMVPKFSAHNPSDFTEFANKSRL